MSPKKTFEAEIAGRKLICEFSDMAEQANGSVLVRYGDTVVFATATMSDDKKEGMSYFPLSVDYEEKFYAAGQILGSRFMRREGRPSEEAVLISRLIDRTIRPLFNHKMRHAVHVVVLVLSVDGENNPNIPAITAASIALGVSDIPWGGPIAAVRVGGRRDNFLINPTKVQTEEGEMDIVVSGKGGKINMVEAGAKELPEDVAVEAFNKALEEIKKLEDFQNKIIKEVGRPKKEIIIPETPKELLDSFNKHFKERLNDILYIFDKATRKNRLGELKDEWMGSVTEHFGAEVLGQASDVYEEMIDKLIHKNILEEGKRPDSRKTNELRNISSNVAILPRTHGSGLFYRGETHVLSIATLGAPGDVQLVEGMEIQTKKRFMHHYNFLPFSTGETGRMGSPGRREIGHGALAERAMLPVLPSKETFPYTIRLVSEILSSNGSTSMASVCASILAMMDAGIPIKNPVAGIAMGLIMGDGGEYKVLTDIQGPEDHHGDMDFKAAGTKNGLTAIQMDVKVEGVSVQMLADTLKDARDARIKIMDVMLQTLPASREELSPLAPRIITHMIHPDKIREVIGPGGKTINKIIEDTGVEIDIEQDGSVYITASSKDAAEKALDIVKQITREYKVGDTFVGKVTRIFEFGAMVEIGPRQEGLVHISELADWRVNKVIDVVQPGDTVPVKLIGIDDQGRMNLSLKEMKKINKPEGYQESDPRGPRRDGGFGGGGRRGGGDRRGSGR